MNSSGSASALKHCFLLELVEPLPAVVVQPQCAGAVAAELDAAFADDGMHARRQRLGAVAACRDSGIGQPAVGGVLDAPCCTAHSQA